MWINGANLCIGCMKPLDDSGKCSFCHLEQDQYEPIPRCLLPGTVLAERYVLGRVLGGGEFWYYLYGVGLDFEPPGCDQGILSLGFCESGRDPWHG